MYIYICMYLYIHISLYIYILILFVYFYVYINIDFICICICVFLDIVICLYICILVLLFLFVYIYIFIYKYCVCLYLYLYIFIFIFIYIFVFLLVRRISEPSTITIPGLPQQQRSRILHGHKNNLPIWTTGPLGFDDYRFLPIVSTTKKGRIGLWFVVQRHLTCCRDLSILHLTPIKVWQWHDVEMYR